MSDYRDDRQALKQRLEELEAELAELRGAKAELEASQARLTELERENFELSNQLERARKPKIPMKAEARVQLIIVAAVLGGGVLVSVMMLARGTSPPPPPARVVASPPATPVTRPRPAPEPPKVELSPTCRCPGDQAALGYTIGATMSFGANSTYMLSYVLRVSNEAGVKDVELLADVQTAPGPKLEGGQVEMLMACLPDRVVFALDQRVTAWSTESGSPLWSATLPAPVGSAKNGALRVDCKPLEVRAGRVIVPNAGGRSVFDAANGASAADSQKSGRAVAPGSAPR